MLRFHTPAHRTVRADFPHTALRLASLASTRWVCLASGVTPKTSPTSLTSRVLSVTAESLAELIGRCQSPDCWSLPVTCQKSGSFPRPALPGFVSSTSLSATPKRPGLLLTEFRLRDTTSHRWGFPCSDDLLLHACRRHYPGGTVGCCRYLVQRQRPSLKRRQVGFRVCPFRGLLSVHSRSGLHGR